jgi:hypothetical protein
MKGLPVPLVVGALCLCSLSSAVGQPEAAPAARPELTRGQLFYGLYCWASDLSRGDGMRLVKETGFKLISTLVSASQEPDILKAAENGLAVAGILGANSFGRTMDLDGWRKEVRRAVERLGPGGSLWKENPAVPAMPIRYWIIWGEPGTELKPPGDMMPDEAYAALLKVAYEEIKIHGKDLVVVAMSPIGTYGSLPSPEWVSKENKVMGAYAFIRGVHDHGGFPYYDCIDIHPFSFPMPSETAGLPRMIEWLKEEMRSRGQEKPIWFTEIGFALSYGPANPFHLTKDQAADYMVRCLALSARHGVQTLTITYVFDQISSSTGIYKAYGYYNEGKTRPIAVATKLMIDLIPEPELLEVISDGENIGDRAYRSSDRPYEDTAFYCYKFRGRNASEVYVVWSEGRPFKYRLKVPADKMTLYNREILGGLVYSKENGSISAAGEMTIPVSTVPLFISTEVTPEQEKATMLYLKPPKVEDWTPIHGRED